MHELRVYRAIAPDGDCRCFSGGRRKQDRGVDHLFQKALEVGSILLFHRFVIEKQYDPAVPLFFEKGDQAENVPRRQLGAGTLEIVEADELVRSEEHTSELQSLMRISYAVFRLKKKTPTTDRRHPQPNI